MIFRSFCSFLLLVASIGGNAAPKAPDGDQAFLAAHDAFRTGDALALARHAAKLEGHLLAPYLEYWSLKLRLEEAGAPEVRAYLRRHAGSYTAERLRADWLKELGRRGDWQTFELERAPLVQDDLEIRCYAWSARLARGEADAFDEAEAMWLEPKELPGGCAALADTMHEAGRLPPERIWARVRVLFESGQLAAAKRVLGYLPAGEAPEERQLSLAASSPQRLLARPPKDLERRQVREMVLFAFVRLARTDPRPAAEVLKGPLGAQLPEDDARYLWGRIAYEGARRHLREALDWYRAAGETALGDEKLAWKARAALRAPDWATVREAIDAMSVAARQDPAWSYWYGRALAAQGEAAGARAYFLRISGQPSFYGLLAAEELGEALAIPQPFHAPGEAEVAAARAEPGIARALELIRLGLRTEGVREWIFAIRAMDDPQLLAAAEVARLAEVFDRAINTADKTARLHNYKVRFLAPFRDVFREQARSFELEEAWVLGLARQESRFIADATSSAGAKGLMQLMPATARWVARRVGIAYSRERVAEVRTNVTLGVRYLRYVLDELGHPVLALAAYNAGPSRARRWRDARPLEGAVYAETIPFNETRDYVKKVMANTVFYAMLLGGNAIGLKERLGTIPAKSAGERAGEELP